jgi:hypothetical protein
MNRIMKSLIQRLVNWAALRGIVANGVYRTAANIINTLSSATTGPCGITSSEQATASEVMHPFSMRYGYASPDLRAQAQVRDYTQELMRAWDEAIRCHPLRSIITPNDQIPNPNDTPRDEVIVRPLP